MGGSTNAVHLGRCISGQAGDRDRQGRQAGDRQRCMGGSTGQAGDRQGTGNAAWVVQRDRQGTGNAAWVVQQFFGAFGDGAFGECLWGQATLHDDVHRLGAGVVLGVVNTG
jgi:hypothetical protein